MNYITAAELTAQGWTASQIALLGSPDTSMAAWGRGGYQRGWRMTRILDVKATERWRTLAGKAARRASRRAAAERTFCDGGGI